MRRRVSPIVVVVVVVTLMTSSLAATAARIRVDASSWQSPNLSYFSSPSTAAPPGVGTTHHPASKPTSPSPKTGRLPTRWTRIANTSNKSPDQPCRLANVGAPLTSRAGGGDCGMPDAVKLSRHPDPVSALLKSFFDAGDALTSPIPAKRKSAPARDDARRKADDEFPSTSLWTTELARDRHEFLRSVDATGDFDGDFLGPDRRRSAAGEDVDEKAASDSCEWNRHPDETLTYDCASAAALTGNNVTVNRSLHNDEFWSFSPVEMVSMIVVGIILGSICLATVIGNALVLVAIVSNGHLRGTTHYFIANLAVADLLLGVSVLPFSATLETIDRWVFGEAFCDVWAAMDVLCCTASILSLCVISVDRYVGVTRPLQHSVIMSERRAGWVIVVVWLLSLAISVAPLFGWKEPRAPDSDPAICSVTMQTGYVLFSVAGSFYIPLSVILVVYFRVYREAVRQSRFLTTGVKTTDLDSSGVTLRIHTGRMVAGGSGETSRKGSVAAGLEAAAAGHHRPAHLRITVAGKLAKFKREKKAAKTLGIVVGVFVLCWFPFFFILPLGKQHIYHRDQLFEN